MTQQEITEGKILIAKFLHSNGLKAKAEWLFDFENPADEEKMLMFYFTEVSPRISFNELMEFLVAIDSFTHNDFAYETIVGPGNYCGIIQYKDAKRTLTLEGTTIDFDTTPFTVTTPDNKLESIFIAIVKFVKWFNNR